MARHRHSAVCGSPRQAHTHSAISISSCSAISSYSFGDFILFMFGDFLLPTRRFPLTYSAIHPPIHSAIFRHSFGDFSPASLPGTVSPLHFDETDSYLVQVRGTKRLLLWPEKELPSFRRVDATALVGPCASQFACCLYCCSSSLSLSFITDIWLTSSDSATCSSLTQTTFWPFTHTHTHGGAQAVSR